MLKEPEFIQVPFGKIRPWGKNPRNIKTEELKKLAKSIQTKGQFQVLTCWGNGDGYETGGGNMRWQAMENILKYSDDKLVWISLNYPEGEKEKIELSLLDNQRFGQYDEQALAELVYPYLEEINLEDFKVDIGEPMGLKDLIEDYAPNLDEVRKTLLEKFIIPPFTILDTRQWYWQERKRTWIDLGIKSEIGRHDNLLAYQGKKAICSQDSLNRFRRLSDKYHGGDAFGNTGTSIFDPVLCELIYQWFCPEKGLVFDPFAGGSVRGIIAEYLGYKYTGIELRPEQIKANKEQSKAIKVNPKWIKGDSIKANELAKDNYDLIFSCPPYFDLEIYSDLEGELSTIKNYLKFLKKYREIIKKSVVMLKEDRFACFVVGDIRDKKGFYRNFVSDTISAFQDSGMILYNEAILVNSIGSLPIRVGRIFGSYRKLGKCHQNVLIFYKGNPKKIKENYKEIKVDFPEEKIRATRQ